MTTKLELSESELRHGRLRQVKVVALLATIALAVVAAAAGVVAVSRGALKAQGSALAVVTMPRGGGQITRLAAIAGRERQVIALRARGSEVFPVKPLPPGESVTIQATVKRPGWIAWLSGTYEHLRLTVSTPRVRVRSAFLTRRRGRPLTVSFTGAVARAGYRNDGSARLVAGVLGAPQDNLVLNESAQAGSAKVAFAARSWELASKTTVSWFPAGRTASVITTPAPGTAIKPDTPITLMFSKPVSNVLGGSDPKLSPQTTGSWRQLNSRTLEFVPTGYGYGLAATVTVGLPSGVQLVGRSGAPVGGVAQWSVPGGSTAALEQMLAGLGYLPVRFHPSSTGSAASSPTASAAAAGTSAGDVTSVQALEAAAVAPPAGTYSWRYPHTPDALKALWSPTQFTELTKGAVMAFENTQGLAVDGVPGPEVWKALINAVVKHETYNFGYTFVMVSEKLPETIHVWHNGRIVVAGLANTGIPASPTATGTYAVYLHIPVGTMSGLNPDGTPYHDTGIPWISYFNGGDALHGFIRASYGFPQSLGCVEMPFSEAGLVYPYTPIGTIVHITAA
ncbi:MAG: L,D-transpeptidase family protein [Solirubrobacteraceae bacterium]